MAKSKQDPLKNINRSARLSPDLFTDKITQTPTRNGYGEGLVHLGKRNKNVVVLCADLTDSTRSSYFQKVFPKRFIEIGVAEQNLVTVAAGLARAGKIPFISSYAMFCPGRCWEQIRTTICYNDMPVKIAGAHAGVSVGPDGATHQAIEDISLMRSLPNMVVIVPCDELETKKATIAVGRIKSPAYVRFARENTPVMTTKSTPFKIGQAQVFKNGKSAAIVACGPLVYEALLAAKQLEEEGISVMVINNHTIKPLDEQTLIQAAKKTGAILTLEEHQIIGGLGSAVSELLAENYPVPMKRIGIRDRFGESGEPNELLEKFKLTNKHIVKELKELLKLKRKLN